MKLKRGIKVKPHQAVGAWQVKQADSVTPRTVIAVNKNRVKLEVAAKMPDLAKDTILYVEIKYPRGTRPTGLAYRYKRERLKELNETWRDIDLVSVTPEV